MRTANQSRKETKMTLKKIESLQTRESIQFETAIAIRQLLADAKARYDALEGDWDNDDVETRVIELVTEDD